MSAFAEILTTRHPLPAYPDVHGQCSPSFSQMQHYTCRPHPTEMVTGAPLGVQRYKRGHWRSYRSRWTSTNASMTKARRGNSEYLSSWADAGEDKLAKGVPSPLEITSYPSPVLAKILDSDGEKACVATIDDIKHQTQVSTSVEDPSRTGVLGDTFDSGVRRSTKASREPSATAAANTTSSFTNEDKPKKTARALKREKVKMHQIVTRMRWLKEAGRSGRWQDVVPIIEDMLSRKLVLDARPFTLAIKALGDSRQTEQALDLLEVCARISCLCTLEDMSYAVFFWRSIMK